MTTTETSEPFATPDDLAAMLSVPRADILRWRIQYGWPSLKVGRNIRFTPEHVAQILERLDATPERTVTSQVAVAGQTARSQRARRSA